MEEVIIQENESGQRLDRFLRKYLRKAPDGFLYKMLRKKNIVLNGKKATGHERICAGDRVRLYVSRETIEKFSGKGAPSLADIYPEGHLQILYENQHILILDKPAGMLSQKARPEDISMVEYLTSYLLAQGALTERSLASFRPSVCNRLDRNTSGILLAGKTLYGSQTLSALLKSRSLRKYYLCLVRGKLTKPGSVHGYLKRDKQTHRVEMTGPVSCPGPDWQPVQTDYEPLAWGSLGTLLKVRLVTGRTHQIRAQLALEGHPIAGDYKYGNRDYNAQFRRAYGLTSQLLHAFELQMPELLEPLSDLSGQRITAPLPDLFARIIKEGQWEHGIQEVFEVLRLRT